jgi:hypothetical protein
MGREIRRVPVDWKHPTESNPYWRKQEARRIMRGDPESLTSNREDCGARVGPVWKLDGEVCTCIRPAGHTAEHECDCGAWFA